MMKIPQLILPAFFLSIFRLQHDPRRTTLLFPPRQTPYCKQEALLWAGAFCNARERGNSRFPGWETQWKPVRATMPTTPPWTSRYRPGRELPLVFIHGYGQSARCWQTTPDGREGFNNIFLRKRYAICLVDLPEGVGRAERRRKPPSSRLPTSSSGLTSSGSANGRHSTREYSSLRTRIPWTSFSAK